MGGILTGDFIEENYDRIKELNKRYGSAITIDIMNIEDPEGEYTEPELLGYLKINGRSSKKMIIPSEGMKLLRPKENKESIELNPAYNNKKP